MPTREVFVLIHSEDYDPNGREGVAVTIHSTLAAVRAEVAAMAADGSCEATRDVEDDGAWWYGRGVECSLRYFPALAPEPRVDTIAEGGILRAVYLDGRLVPHHGYDFDALDGGDLDELIEIRDDIAAEVRRDPGSRLADDLLTWMPTVQEAVEDRRSAADPCPRCGGGHDRIDSREPCPEVDTASSASRQHWIETGRYLRVGEADSV